jgi:hypothetical protein
MATVAYTEVVKLAEQLTEMEQKNLIAFLLTEQKRQRSLNVEEKLQLLDTLTLPNEVNETPSIRREDWYGDDGR